MSTAYQDTSHVRRSYASISYSYFSIPYLIRRGATFLLKIRSTYVTTPIRRARIIRNICVVPRQAKITCKCVRFVLIVSKVMNLEGSVRGSVRGVFCVTFTGASVFVDDVSRPGWGGIEFAFLLDLFFSSVSIYFFSVASATSDY